MGYKEYWLPFEVILNPPDQIDYGPISTEINIIKQDFSVFHTSWESNCIRLTSIVGEENRTPNPPLYLFWPNNYTSKMVKFNLGNSLIKYFLVSEYKANRIIHYHVLKTDVPINKYSIRFQLVPANKRVVIEKTEFRTRRTYLNYVLTDLYYTHIQPNNIYGIEPYKSKYIIKKHPRSKPYKTKSRYFVKESEVFYMPITYLYKIIKNYTEDFTNVFLNFKYKPYTTLDTDNFETIFATITLGKNTSPLLMRGKIYVIKDNNDNT